MSINWLALYALGFMGAYHLTNPLDEDAAPGGWLLCFFWPVVLVIAVVFFAGVFFLKIIKESCR